MTFAAPHKRVGALDSPPNQVAYVSKSGGMSNELASLALLSCSVLLKLTESPARITSLPATPMVSMRALPSVAIGRAVTWRCEVVKLDQLRVGKVPWQPVHRSSLALPGLKK